MNSIERCTIQLHNTKDRVIAHKIYLFSTKENIATPNIILTCKNPLLHYYSPTCIIREGPIGCRVEY